MTMQRIQGWYDYWDGNVYVSISGGKDSQVLAHIVKEMYPDVPLVFVNTGLEYDSVRLKGTEMADEVLRPKMNFVQVITKYGYPVISKEIAHKLNDYQSALRNGYENSYVKRQFEGTYVSKNGKVNGYSIKKYAYLTEAPFRISHLCCNVMKKNPSNAITKTKGLMPIIGTMAVESSLRKQMWIRYGCNAFEKNRPTSQPLSFWTEQDILQYINENSLAIAEVYGEIIEEGGKLKTTGADRTGCVFCMFGIGQDTERFLRLKIEEPKKYDYVMRGGKFDETGMWIPDKGLGYKFVIDWLNEHGNMGIKY
jgi:3'-phosphoadenosine 5'-phosphosulfate sulfotransferase (PAPS reductase)/FAD synthetase